MKRRCDCCGFPDVKVNWVDGDTSGLPDARPSRYLCDICYKTDIGTLPAMPHPYQEMMASMAYCTNAMLAATKNISDRIDGLDEAIAR